MDTNTLHLRVNDQENRMGRVESRMSGVESAVSALEGETKEGFRAAARQNERLMQIMEANNTRLYDKLEDNADNSRPDVKWAVASIGGAITILIAFITLWVNITLQPQREKDMSHDVRLERLVDIALKNSMKIAAGDQKCEGNKELINATTSLNKEHLTKIINENKHHADEMDKKNQDMMILWQRYQESDLIRVHGELDEVKSLADKTASKQDMTLEWLEKVDSIGTRNTTNTDFKHPPRPPR